MFRGLVALTLIALTAACAPPGAARPGSGGSDTNSGAALEQQARQDLAWYDRAVTAAGHGAVLHPVGPLTQQIGQWSPSEAEHKRSFVSNLFIAGADPGAAAPRTGQIRWTGHRTSVPLISASAALERMSSAADDGCDGCVPLRLTHPHLGLMKLATIRGSASVPAWIFAVAGSRVRVAHPAVATDAMVTVTPVPGPADGVAMLATTLAADGQTLTVSFTGAPGPASTPCGADYTAHAVESPRAVVVIVREQRAPGEGACPAVGATRTATVTLAAPLADRAVLDLPYGTPLTTGAT